MTVEQLPVGETLMVGFDGPTLPSWLRFTAEHFGLGGVILFDFSLPRNSRDNNIQSPDQLAALCDEIHALPGRPLVFVDQEGGKVRRLKEDRGFALLPSAEQMSHQEPAQRLAIWELVYSQMAHCGIDFNLAPVIDLNTNPDNPDIGAIGRSPGADPAAIRALVEELDGVARKHGIKLALKHYPGLGGARVNSHDELTNLTSTISEDQLQLFTDLGERINGQAILVSHGIVEEWDPQLPVSVSKPALAPLRTQHPQILLISDDIQMGALRKKLPTDKAIPAALSAGIDLVCVGNNLIDEGNTIPDLCRTLARRVQQDREFGSRVRSACHQVKKRKMAMRLKGS